MIYSVTFNPALDYVVGIENLQLDAVNRTKFEKILPGGKGINVSVALGNLGLRSVALGFVVGFTGKEISARTESCGVSCDFIEVHKGLSRINVKIKAEEEFEINGQGPCISALDVKRLFGQLDALVPRDFLIVSGSIPPTVPSDIYEQILSYVADRGVYVVVDATKDLLPRISIKRMGEP
ncbi:MAG: PfkB family carbohydrate kinase [Atopobiaceae bacterium]|jgi:1-phosphofructokinase